MSVRITNRTDGHRTVIYIAGRLDSVAASILDAEIRSIAGLWELDLSELMSVDTTGLKMLRMLASRGVELRGVSGYVRFLLDQQG